MSKKLVEIRDSMCEMRPKGLAKEIIVHLSNNTCIGKELVHL